MAAVENETGNRASAAISVSEGELNMDKDKRLALIATAVREEIVRQYRDDERRKCTAGVLYYEEEVMPWLIVKVAARVADETAAIQ